MIVVVSVVTTWVVVEDEVEVAGTETVSSPSGVDEQAPRISAVARNPARRRRFGGGCESLTPVQRRAKLAGFRGIHLQIWGEAIGTDQKVSLATTAETTR